VKLRGVQCAVSDPVSFALAAERTHADFPNVGGWSVRDVARRAVAEHHAWFGLQSGESPQVRGWMDAQPDPSAATVATLGRLFTAARAALLAESVDGGSPELPLTVAAVAKALSHRNSGARSIVDAAHGAYREGCVGGSSPRADVVAAFAAAIRRLPPYERR